MSDKGVGNDDEEGGEGEGEEEKEGGEANFANQEEYEASLDPVKKAEYEEAVQKNEKLKSEVEVRKMNLSGFFYNLFSLSAA